MGLGHQRTCQARPWIPALTSDTPNSWLRDQHSIQTAGFRRSIVRGAYRAPYENRYYPVMGAQARKEIF